MKQIILKTLPWLITLIALYLAFSGINWEELVKHIKTGNIYWIFVAILLTVFSYVLRAWRWRHFFPEDTIKFIDAYKILVLGFFMNNILPARAGELIRAHIGAKITNQKRTLVLATVASERLADGLMLSLLFVVFAFSSTKSLNSDNIFYVALLFFIVAICVFIVLAFKEKVFAVFNFLSEKVNHKATDYAADRVQVFIHGLSPMFNIKRFPKLFLYSLIVWMVELLAYYCIVVAFNADLSLAACVLFLVAVNFSSLIPAAPGGIGVIEAVASAILVGIGINRELALSMVMTQHVIQYLVIAVPGIIFTISLKKYLKEYKEQQELEHANASQ